MCDGYGVAPKVRGSGEYIDRFPMVEWAGAEAGNQASHWAPPNNGFRAVAMDRHELPRVFDGARRVSGQTVGQRDRIPPLNGEGWPDERFGAEPA
ncbi:hypothetical protein ACFQZ2_09025 [Streptomonospora algeriensis]|uniref:Uncharacterized protein n=1 Tax=Streptomonospora algeriensis TaxID=995084 RepID=A0ABW3BC33_9ACTN